jgi:hypothetical protein
MEYDGKPAINIKVEGNGKIVNLFEREFEYFIKNGSENPDIIFNFSSNQNLDHEYYVTGDSKKSKEYFTFKIPSSADVNILLDNRLLKVDVKLIPSFKKKVGNILPQFYKIANSKYASIEDMMYQGFIWDVLQPMLQICFLNHNRTFLHGSSLVDKSGNVAIFTGWGGSGKTSISSYILLNDIKGYSFLSDDLSIIDVGGKVYYNPTYIHLYPYNMPSFPKLELTLRNHQSGLIDKIQWDVRKKLYGPKGVCRRVSPKDIYHNNLGESGKLDKVFYFQRYSGDNIIIEKTSSELMSKLTSNVIYYEIKNWVNFLSAYNCTPIVSDTSLPNINEFINKTQECLEAAFKDKNIYTIKVPISCTPDRLLDALYSYL